MKTTPLTDYLDAPKRQPTRKGPRPEPLPRAILPHELENIFLTMVEPPFRDFAAENECRPHQVGTKLYRVYWRDWSGARLCSRPYTKLSAAMFQRKTALRLLADKWGVQQVCDWSVTCSDSLIRKVGRSLLHEFVRKIDHDDRKREIQREKEQREADRQARNLARQMELQKEEEAKQVAATPAHAPQLARALGISEELARYLATPSF